MTTNSSSSSTTKDPITDAFSNYTGYLDRFNDKRERVVKASRGITNSSKKVIFLVHRISKDNKEEVLQKAKEELDAVTNQYVSQLVKELEGTDYWKLRRSYSQGIQEYVEAAIFCNFCSTGSLLLLDEMNAALLPLSDPSVEPWKIHVHDYILGLADLTGELMRLAMGRLSGGEPEFAAKICRFVQSIYRELSLLAPHMDGHREMKAKMEKVWRNLVKIENSCFNHQVRKAEYGPLLEDKDLQLSLDELMAGLQLE